MARHASQAEHYRAHREAFMLAMELGCTPREAEAELRRRRAAARDREATERLETKMTAAPSSRGVWARWDAPWMMRD